MIAVSAGAEIDKGDPVLAIKAGTQTAVDDEQADVHDPDAIRPDLAVTLERRQALQDDSRPEAVARRRKTDQLTARENLALVFDDGTFSEYGEFAVAAQRERHSAEELRRMSPADGIVTGVGQVNASAFGEEGSRCVGLAYDYTVLAGTQGYYNHAKTDRVLELADEGDLPVVLFAEGGGGRPGDTDWKLVAGLNVPTFARFAGLNGRVPMIGVVSGRCFAGNAALLGCCDVIIATPGANIGMGGPAMVEGGGLGVHRPEEIGPVSVQEPNGVIDILVENDEAAALTARRYLSYFQGATAGFDCIDQRALRHMVPEDRKRAYDVRPIIETLADSGSVMELRSGFGIGVLTALVRIEGRPFGLIANNPRHLGGAIDADAADKTARFLQLCNAFGLPLVTLVDTPGFMVGPEAEKSAQVRHFSRIFVTAAKLDIPVFAIVLRKSYGLGAMAMMAGGSHRPFVTAAWPSGEFGAMGLEGAVRLGFKKELEAVRDPTERQALFDRMVEESYARGSALNTASALEIDTVIDPHDTRELILKSVRIAGSGKGKKPASRMIDTW